MTRSPKLPDEELSVDFGPHGVHVGAKGHRAILYGSILAIVLVAGVLMLMHLG